MTTLTLPIYQKKSMSFTLPADGFKTNKLSVWTFYIDVKSLKSIDFPLDSNVRKPGDTTATKNMISTLEDAGKQSRFWVYNGGLIIVAKKCTKKKSGAELELDLPKEYGLMNGGHTQYAIKEALKTVTPTNTLVRVEIIEGDFTDEELADIAEARNTSKNVKSMSLAWKKKKFVRLRKRMHPDYEKLISWTENLVANPAKTGEEMVFILMMMNSLDYPGLGAKTPSKVASSSSGPFNTWQNNLAKYQFLDEICDEIITLHDTILSSFDKNPSTPGLLNSKFSGKDIFKNKNLKDTPFLKLKTSRSMDGGILLPLLSSFRTIIEVDPTKKQVRWSADPLATWNAAKLDLMKALLGQIKTSKKVLDIRNEGNFWHLCALIVSGHATGNSTNWRSYK